MKRILITLAVISLNITAAILDPVMYAIGVSPFILCGVWWLASRIDLTTPRRIVGYASYIGAILFIAGSIVSVADAPSNWFPVWVKLSKFQTLMQNDTQRAKMVSLGTNLVPVVNHIIRVGTNEPPVYSNTGPAQVEMYLWKQYATPNLWTNAAGEEWMLLFSNGGQNMFGHKFSGRTTNANWLGQVRSEMKALNPIEGGYFTENITQMGNDAGLYQVQGDVDQ